MNALMTATTHWHEAFKNIADTKLQAINVDVALNFAKQTLEANAKRFFLLGYVLK